MNEAFANDCNKICFKACSSAIPFALDFDFESDKIGSIPLLLLKSKALPEMAKKCAHLHDLEEDDLYKALE